jgi:hypothetical protein
MFRARKTSRAALQIALQEVHDFHWTNVVRPARITGM